MPVYDPEPRMIEVRSNLTMGNKLLLKFYPNKMEIEIKHRGVIYIIKLQDLLKFANNSELDVFHAKAAIEDNDEL